MIAKNISYGEIVNWRGFPWIDLDNKTKWETNSNGIIFIIIFGKCIDEKRKYFKEI